MAKIVLTIRTAKNGQECGACPLMGPYPHQEAPDTGVPLCPLGRFPGSKEWAREHDELSDPEGSWETHRYRTQTCKNAEKRYLKEMKERTP